MNEDMQPVYREDVRRITSALAGDDIRGVYVEGRAGAGKTTLLRMAELELAAQGFTPVLLEAGRVRGPDRIGPEVIDVLAATGRIVTLPDLPRRSSGRLADSLLSLKSVSAQLRRPVLLLDGIDEWLANLSKVDAVFTEMVDTLVEWQFVISSRMGPRRLGLKGAQFYFIRLDRMVQAEAVQLLARLGPDMPQGVKDDILSWSQGSPLLIRLAGEYWRTAGSSFATAGHLDETRTADFVAARLLGSMPPTARRVLQRLCVLTAEDITSLTEGIGISEDEWDGLRHHLGSLIVTDSRTVFFVHSSLQRLLLRSFLQAKAFRLDDLEFGAEEGEHDDLLNVTYVDQIDAAKILSGARTVVVGMRGSGKSALVRRMAEGREPLPPGTMVAELTDPGRRLHGLLVESGWSDREQLRVAWSLLIAGLVAERLPEVTDRELSRMVRAIRKALGTTPAPTGWKRLLTYLGRHLGGTTLSFSLGPVNLTTKPPPGVSAFGERGVDVYAFLRSADDAFRASSSSLICVIDHTDEVAKYDRPKQEAAVQALLHAEKDFQRFQQIHPVVFIRSDLFDIFDLQEKNKLISRTLRLSWSDDHWIRMFVRRLIHNAGLEWLAGAFRTEDPDDARLLLRALLPATVEGRPVDLWLSDNLRNGNGDIAPRLGVLLLYSLREKSPHRTEKVSSLPLYSEATMSDAMSEVSRLAYEEIVNDFKVAPTFVRNSRAAQLDNFSVDQVKALFDESEGPVSRQVAELERLGYLERVLIPGTDSVEVALRVPALYTKGWR